MIFYKLKDEYKYVYIEPIHNVKFKEGELSKYSSLEEEKEFITLIGYFNFGFKGCTEQWHTLSLPRNHFKKIVHNNKTSEDWL